VKEAGDCPTFRRFLALTMVTESGFSSLSLPPSDEYLECTVMLQGAARTRTKTKGRLPVSPFLQDFLLKKCLAANQLPPPPLLAKRCLPTSCTEVWRGSLVQIRLVKCSTAVRRTLFDRP